MRRLLLPVIGAFLLAMAPAPASADTSPSPSPSTTTTSPAPSPDPSPSTSATDASPSPSPSPTMTPAGTATPIPTPTPIPTTTTAPAPAPAPAPGGGPTSTPPSADPATQQLIEEARQQLGGGVANALATVQRLADVLNQNTSEQAQIQRRVEDSQQRMDALDRQIEQLDDDMATTQNRIDTERVQVGVLARALYQQPDSLLLRLLRAGSLTDLLTQTSDLATAAVRADTLRGRLSSDLRRLQQDQIDRQKAKDEEQRIQQQLDSALGRFEDLAHKLQDTSDQLQSVIDDGQSALSGIDAQGASIAQQAADLLQKREQELVATAEQQVWQQAELWATLNGSAIPPPVATTYDGGPTGTRFALPIQGAVLTQGFGPTDLWLEPPMYGFPHFHTGLDLSSANPRIGAAADGVVAAVGTGTTGYGNYVIIVHGGGLVTLYGHLSVTMASVGDRVTQGQQIGVEGSTGASTGVHLHF
ncbi:MAG TPA: peptidoglycan DD-metalloendopeptidase family protein, partial [Candidatus Eisenbacteria bacterium]|nr:peptidoglycan DD-metalloendopeptidase family protein [Candidatus Eisenbacteria bacterium]